jgi:hypothetical protein
LKASRESIRDWALKLPAMAVYLESDANLR